MRPSFKLPQRLTKVCTSQPRDCALAPPEPIKVRTAAVASGGGKSVPCSMSYGDLKSGPEAIVPGSAQLGPSSHPADLGKFPAPGSLPVSIGGRRRYVGSVSVTEVEQSEDYTCNIAHGPNPKTTRIFGDCSLEPCTVRVSDGERMEAVEVKEGAESYWLVKCVDNGEAVDEYLSSFLCCKKKLHGNDACIYRGEKAFCSANCRDDAIFVEDQENSTAISSLSSVGSASSFNNDIHGWNGCVDWTG